MQADTLCTAEHIAYVMMQVDGRVASFGHRCWMDYDAQRNKEKRKDENWIVENMVKLPGFSL